MLKPTTLIFVADDEQVPCDGLGQPMHKREDGTWAPWSEMLSEVRYRLAYVPEDAGKAKEE